MFYFVQSLPVRIFLYVLLCCAGIGFSLHARAQNSVLNGQIVNAETYRSIPFASIVLDKNHTFQADSLGHFSIPISAGKHTIRVRSTGFRIYESIIDADLSSVHAIQIELEPFQNQLDQVVVSASRDARKVSREVASISVVRPYLIENASLQDLSQVLNRVPGVQVVDGQATIRGGAGYSYNTGSRVTVLLDDMPLLGADLGDVRWKFMPIEAAGQIEVIKGSSSVLYGSAALNGTINIRTVWPGKKPETKIQVYQGVMQNFDRKYIQWWEPMSQPFNTGLMFSHRQSWGNFDFVCSGNLSAQRSHLQYADETRGRIFVKTRYRSKRFPGLSYGIDGNMMLEKSGRFLLWADADSGALKQFNNTNPMEDIYRITSIDPHIEWHRKKYANFLRFRFYQIKRYIDKSKYPSGYDAIANLYALDEHVNNKWTKNMNSTSGIYATTMWSKGNVYPGQFYGYSIAIFSQFEYTLGRLKAVAGGRYEWSGYDTVPYKTGLLKQFGLNYAVNDRTFIRANYSEGYRVPTISEKYVEDKVSFLNVLPNPALKPESGWTAEIGLQRAIRIHNFTLSLDADIFVQNYKHMIDFKIDQWIKPSYTIDSNSGQITITPGVIGFKAINIGNVLAGGYELSASGEGKIEDVMIRVIAGFTQSLPVLTDANADASKLSNPVFYTQQFVKSLTTTRIDSGTYLYSVIAPYRNRKIGKLDLELEYHRFNIGYNVQYYSLYEKVDPFVFYALKMNEFFAKSGPTDYIHNIRFYYLPSKTISIGILINNVTNKEYATRPGKLEPARTFSVQCKYLF